MTDRLTEVAARRQSIDGLRQVVDAMRSLAAVRQQQAAATLPGIRSYSAVIGSALARAVALMEEAPTRWPSGNGHSARPLTVLFTAEHGFVGGFAERLLAAAKRDGDLWIVGARGAVLAMERGIPVGWTGALATHTDAVPTTARMVAEAIDDRARRDLLGRLEIVYARTEAGSEKILCESLLPVDLTRFNGTGNRPAPLANLEPRRLVERLVGEYLYAQLTHAAMESFAAENAARLSVMVAARQNVDEKLAELTGEERRLRQEDITNEVIELAAGRV